MSKRPLPGSERRLPENARDIGPADPEARFQVTVLLRRRDAGAFKDRLAARLRGGGAGEILSRAAFAAAYGAEEADAAAVAAFAAAHNLEIVTEDLARRTIVLAGKTVDFEAAFGVSLRAITHPNGAFRGRVGVISLPEDLVGRVEAVLGLDNRPQARSHHRVRTPSLQALAASPTAFTPVQLAGIYGFPSGDGAGETIALIELGGGFVEADLTTYFSGLGIAPAPTVSAVSVDGAQNQPSGSANGPDGEVMLDIEVAGGVASGARIAVYFAPNTDAGFLDAVTTAAHDTTNKPSVISISWGGPESSWTSQATTALDEAIGAAGLMGVTVCVASGDSGSGDGVSDGADHVDFPASSPHALGCGGTTLTAPGGAGGETVWNDGAQGGAGGGGVSALFPLPAWQQGLSTTSAADGSSSPLAMRGVPDVCGDADPQTGYSVRVDGADTVIGGTSAVAPLWAGLIARINANLGAPVGFINTRLYAAPAAFNDITAGNNGDFAASPGWDACTGLGSPIGTAVQTALTTAAAG